MVCVAWSYKSGSTALLYIQCFLLAVYLVRNLICRPTFPPYRNFVPSPIYGLDFLPISARFISLLLELMTSFAVLFWFLSALAFSVHLGFLLHDWILLFVNFREAKCDMEMFESSACLWMHSKLIYFYLTVDSCVVLSYLVELYNDLQGIRYFHFFF